MTLPLEVAPDGTAAARRVGSLVAARAREAIAARGRFSVALSKAPAAMLEALVEAAPRWDVIDVYQVDERAAPSGSQDRNLTAFVAALPPDAVGSLHPMPVEAPDLDDAAQLYQVELPDVLDLVHLGLGADGHTASLVPGDPVLDVRDDLVAVTAAYQGFRRMTLTYPALDTAREIVWLVTGREKPNALARLLDGDESIPAARVSNPNQLVVADVAAAAGAVGETNGAP
ncbi:MAG: 6-phosphogluconolactonase [Gaiellaceae bacterium]